MQLCTGGTQLYVRVCLSVYIFDSLTSSHVHVFVHVFISISERLKQDQDNDDCKYSQC